MTIVVLKLIFFVIIFPITLSVIIAYWYNIKMYYKLLVIKVSTILLKYLVTKTPDYKKLIIEKNYRVSTKLDKLKIKDIEAHLRYFKSDENTLKTLNEFKISEIENYLRSKKLKKIK